RFPLNVAHPWISTLPAPTEPTIPPERAWSTLRLPLAVTCPHPFVEAPTVRLVHSNRPPESTATIAVLPFPTVAVDDIVARLFVAEIFTWPVPDAPAPTTIVDDVSTPPELSVS